MFFGIGVVARNLLACCRNSDYDLHYECLFVVGSHRSHQANPGGVEAFQRECSVGLSTYQEEEYSTYTPGLFPIHCSHLSYLCQVLHSSTARLKRTCFRNLRGDSAQAACNWINEPRSPHQHSKSYIYKSRRLPTMPTSLAVRKQLGRWRRKRTSDDSRLACPGDAKSLNRNPREANQHYHPRRSQKQSHNRDKIGSSWS